MDKDFLAKAMYDTYCEAVGGKAFNGDDLPGSAEFFADETKKKQADAWRKAADKASEMYNDELGDIELRRYSLQMAQPLQTISLSTSSGLQQDKKTSEKLIQDAKNIFNYIKG